MSCPLPPEILDLVVDHLHDKPTMLKTCCVISKSWIQRTRRHLFAGVEFDNSESEIELWKKAFPDPSNSPAHHTRSLLVHGALAADADVGNWISAFHNVEHLLLSYMDRNSLFPFYGLSSAIRSLRLIIVPLDVDLICSFPLLEDLALVPSPMEDEDGWKVPLTSPKLTGTLDLEMYGRSSALTRRLLVLPGGLRFSKIIVMFPGKDAKSVTDLVSRCSDTLEFLTLDLHPQGAFLQPLRLASTSPPFTHVDASEVPSLDLSKASKLKYLEFLLTVPSVQWITTTLRSVESKNLQFIRINSFDNIREPVMEPFGQEWQDLDRLLVQFWASHSVRPRVEYIVEEGGKDLGGRAPSLLPELTRRGLIDLVQSI